MLARNTQHDEVGMKKSGIKWHVVVFLAPAVLVITAIMIFPLFNTLRLALYT